MFALAFAIGIFSYSIFIAGMINLLYPVIIIPFTLIFWSGCIYWKRNEIQALFQRIQKERFSRFFQLCLGLLAIQAIINFIGLLGPEIGFDALWYHLSFPKLYLQYHAIFHIPGGPFIYSDMPKLTEMLYTAGLAFGSDFFARGIHYLFGILCCVALYKVARKFLPRDVAVFAPVIFYSNVIVGWESVSAYIDLARTFFEILALWACIEWVETKRKVWLIRLGVVVGLSLTTKLLAGGSVVLYGLAVALTEKKDLLLVKKIKHIFLYCFFAILLPLPWVAFAFIHTGNPFYPMFSREYPLGDTWQIYNPLFFIHSFWNTFVSSSDPINPLYLLSIPFIILYWKKLYHHVKLLLFLSLGGFVIWYITPQTGGGRFILPYLPLFTILILYLVTLLNRRWQYIFLGVIILCSLLSIGYRSVAIVKFIPVIIGKESKADFLSQHLAFSLGDFYDIDGYFARNIQPTDTVLLYGFHNLYYVNFPFIDSDWVQKGDLFDYVAVQGNNLPNRFAHWNLVYNNERTQVKLYASPGGLWRY